MLVCLIMKIIIVICSRLQSASMSNHENHHCHIDCSRPEWCILSMIYSIYSRYTILVGSPRIMFKATKLISPLNVSYLSAVSVLLGCKPVKAAPSPLTPSLPHSAFLQQLHWAPENDGTSALCVTCHAGPQRTMAQVHSLSRVTLGPRERWHKCTLCHVSRWAPENDGTSALCNTCHAGPQRTMAQVRFVSCVTLGPRERWHKCTLYHVSRWAPENDGTSALCVTCHAGPQRTMAQVRFVSRVTLGGQSPTSCMCNYFLSRGQAAGGHFTRINDFELGHSVSPLDKESPSRPSKDCATDHCICLALLCHLAYDQIRYN